VDESGMRERAASGEGGAGPLQPANGRAAEDIYSEFLRGGGDAGGGGFAALCARHPAHAEALRFLRSFHGSLSQTVSADGAEASVARALATLLSDDGGAASGTAADSTAAGASGDPDTASALAARATYATSGAKRFEVLREVGRGGMSVVLEVRDPDLDRALALKVLAPRAGPLDERMALALRFLREARILARLEHPGIVPVHEVGIDPEGHVFFTMPLVRGKTLHEALEERRRGKGGWTLARLAAILTRVCHTLSYAHSRGVVHRDLKPANIMVGSFGEAFVMDWGLATEPRREPPAAAPAAPAAGEPAGDFLATQPGSVLGTPAYMPPEQAAGGAADERSDVYAAGAVLYTVLSGRVPYVEPGSAPDSRAIVAAVLAGPPAPLDRIAPAVPAELVAVCERAMAREPAARYASMEELGADLDAYQEGRVVRAHRTGALAELGKWVRRNRAAALAAAAAVLAVVGGLAAVAFFQARARVESLRLGDLHLLDQLEAEVPILEPELSLDPGACVDWLERLDLIYGRLAVHEESLERLRRRGKRLDTRAPRSFPFQLPLSIRHRELREEIARLRNESRKLALFRREYRGWQSPAILEARRRSLDLEVEAVVRERNRIGERLLDFGRWQFASSEDQWLHDQLASIVMELYLHADPDSRGVLRRFQRRLAIVGACSQEGAGRWREAIAAVTVHPAHGGLRLVQHHDLLPLGPDPDSGLWEFAHPDSGQVPARDGRGHLVLGDDSCIVLVLVPGRPAPRRGKPARKPAGNAFFIAKHEMTQSQWQALTGRNPSHFAAGVTVGGQKITARHPVEGITAAEAQVVLFRSGQPGGAVNVIAGGTVAIQNSILWGNGPTPILNAGTTTVEHSDVEGGFAGTGNIDADPLLPEGDWHPGAGSPVLDAGEYLWATQALDLDGNPRVSGPGIDMGALELQSVTEMDADADGIADAGDNCPAAYNPDQRDTDGVPPGDLCDPCPADALDECDPAASAAATIGDAGGLLETPDGTLALQVPPGAVPAPTSFSATSLGQGFALTADIGSGTAVTGFALGPAGVPFEPPLTLELR
jgi:hypothetical protein